MQMIASRALTAHTYNEESANAIVRTIREEYFQEFSELRKRLTAIAEQEQR